MISMFLTLAACIVFLIAMFSWVTVNLNLIALGLLLLSLALLCKQLRGMPKL